MLVSYIFRPRTFVRNRKAAVDSAFVSPLYRGRVSINYGVFHVAISCAFTAFFHRCFYLRSAHFAISIVAFYLYWWPSIFYRRCGTLLVCHRVSA